MPLRNPLTALLDYASQRGNEASSIGSVMSQLAKPILVSQGVQSDETSQRPPQRPVMSFDYTAPTGGTTPQPPRRSDYQAGGGVPATPLPKTTSDTEEYYIRGMQKRGLARHVAEGIVGGMIPESGLNPSINEKNPVVPGSRGGFGLDQLTGPRRIAFERWASENNRNIDDPEAQMDFKMVEFTGPERKAYEALIQAPDAQSAAAIYTEQFLRPGVSHTAQSANEAARMSGQPYNPAIASGLNTGISTMGGPQTAGGALPQTVEGILSSLYPNAAEDEKAAHRKDIWRGLSQGLSALSQGGQVDLSNIAANADARRRQNVLDMRERDRARAGAALIYSQTGDADMAGAVASGVMSINDVFSERERKRLTEQADAQRLKTEQANKALGGLVLGMAGDFGWDEKRTAEVATALDAGADPSTVLTLGERSKLADEARKKEDEAAAAAEKRAAVAEEYAASEDPVLRLTGQLLLSDPDMPVAEGYKLASDRFPVAKDTAVAPTNEMQNADALVASGAINPDTKKPFTPAEATAVLTLPAPAGSEQSNAQNEAQDLFAAKATNPDTKQPFTSYGEALAWRLSSGGPKTSIEVNTGPQGNLSDVALRAVEAEQMIPKGKAFKQTFNPDTKMWEIYRDPTTGQPQTVNIVNPDEAMMDAEKAADLAKINKATADTVISSGKEVLADTTNWETGPVAAMQNYISSFNPQSEFSDVSGKLAAIRDLVALDTIQDMQQSSPTGSTGLGPATERDAARLERRFGELDPTRKPETFRADLMAALNDYSDTIHGSPAEILDMYKKGEISAEVADAMSTRYVVRGAGVDPDAETLGTLTNLGLSNSRDSVLGKLTDKDIAPRVIAKLGPDYDKIINDEGFYDEGGAFDELTPTEQTEIERLLGVIEND